MAIRVYSELKKIWCAQDTEDKRKGFVNCLGVIDTKVTESQLLYLFDIITQYDDPYLKLKSHYSITPKATTFINEKKIITITDAPIK